MKEKEFLEELDPGKMPRHIGIILDGNGRWAEKRGLSRSEGHRAGGENLDRLLDFFAELNIPALSLYAFSTENWKRPRGEVQCLWSLFDEFFTTRLHRCQEKDIRVKVSGNLDRLPKRTRKKIDEVVDLTKKNRAFTANFCLNYGAQDEILNACRSVIRERIEAQREGNVRKALSDVKKKSSKNICTPIPCLR